MKSLILIALVLFLGSISFAGNSVGNAGDITAMEFSWTTALAIKRLRESVLTKEQSAQLNAIEEKLKIVRVTSLPKLILKGIEVNAINYPKEDVIEVSQDGWALVKKSTAVSRLGFSLHEFLGVAGYDDTGYKLSKGLTDRIRDDRFADVAFEENLLNALWSLSYNLHIAGLRPAAKELKKNDTKSYCFFAGRIRGQAQMLSLLISNSSTSLSNPASEQALALISEGASQVEVSCQWTRRDPVRLKEATTAAVEAIHSLVNMISANVELPTGTN
ncbi:hypothetical protein BH10BDE1_BH10BDE1_32990 [soil metagenome]